MLRRISSQAAWSPSRPARAPQRLPHLLQIGINPSTVNSMQMKREEDVELHDGDSLGLLAVQPVLGYFVDIKRFARLHFHVLNGAIMNGCRLGSAPPPSLPASPAGLDNSAASPTHIAAIVVLAPQQLPSSLTLPLPPRMELRAVHKAVIEFGSETVPDKTPPPQSIHVDLDLESTSRRSQRIMSIPKPELETESVPILRRSRSAGGFSFDDPKLAAELFLAQSTRTPSKGLMLPNVFLTERTLSLPARKHKNIDVESPRSTLLSMISGAVAKKRVRPKPSPADAEALTAEDPAAGVPVAASREDISATELAAMSPAEIAKYFERRHQNQAAHLPAVKRSASSILAAEGEFSMIVTGLEKVLHQGSVPRCIFTHAQFLPKENGKNGMNAKRAKPDSPKPAPVVIKVGVRTK